MKIDQLKELGFTPEDILNRIVEKITESYFREDDVTSEFESRIQNSVREQIDARISTAIDTLIKPKIAEMVEGVCLQETNRWGETRGEKLTFIEYLTQRVDAYIREQVNYEGKGKGEGDSYNWQARTTRIAHMVHEHLKYSIETAMKNALSRANSSIKNGLEEAVKIALAGIKVSVETTVKGP